MLEQIFSSKTRVKLLKLFLINPEESYFIREITRKIKEHINSVRRELNNLEKLGLVETRLLKNKKKKYYQVNKNFILYPELRSLIFKAQVLSEKNIISNIKKTGSIKYLVLTGIFCGLDDIATDILIVGKINRQKLRRVLKKFQKHLNRDIRYTVMSRKEYNYRFDLTDRFLYSILENKKIEVINNLNKK